jgi:hypothetical protein
MRKYIPIALFLFSPFLCAFETNYPVVINNGTILINTGVGFGAPINKGLKGQCPPLTASFDAALPIAGLPLSVGLITGYFSETGSDEFHFLPVAGRLAYHFNFNIPPDKPRLDAYLFLTLGAAIDLSNSGMADFWPGVSIGGRYFFHPSIGAYLELGLDKVQNISFGATFKI